MKTKNWWKTKVSSVAYWKFENLKMMTKLICFKNKTVIELTWRYSWLLRMSSLVYRVAKTHRMPYLCRSFSAKELYNQWLFCGKWPASYGSSTPSMYLCRSFFAKEPLIIGLFCGKCLLTPAQCHACYWINVKNDDRSDFRWHVNLEYIDV